MSEAIPQWTPAGPPDVLLPPWVEPEISMDEILDLTYEAYAVLIYRRSGRYLGIYPDRESAEKADPYRYSRLYLPDGILPWETASEAI
jgi:hypothetical protein